MVKKIIQGMRLKKGALHRQLNVAPDKKIPASKMHAAEAGRYGPLAERRAHTAEGILKKGSETQAAKSKSGYGR